VRHEQPFRPAPIGPAVAAGPSWVDAPGAAPGSRRTRCRRRLQPTAERAAGRSKSPALPSSSTQGLATVAEQIMAHHADRDGQLDVAGALQLFSNAFTPLPG
jgi:hypothetical protein